ncbi:TetR/AcrR family transcriptional regulator [Aquicoccus sp. G2-2]|uniref:TetR/AcrR family transcriptional regulator n=1 Tax=Aquicoccus sp. G2-2 TaxID=3092120 RepID=UPI002ADFE2B2|nr:TetR/AcrR family transcriptional regulator [Aquicoccus sp. G2-2]MEA1114035.1 TetR/AcrR family transcriptional regulator [Aquicoccus sp. G2-2]
MTRSRLTPDDWLSAGLEALAKHGPPALKAERLARDLGTTKGSFYWHFKDLPEYHGELAQAWKRNAAQALVDVLESTAPLAKRLAETASGTDDALEPAIRAWARESADAAAALSEIDRLRLEGTHALLRETGITNITLATALLGAAVGLKSLPADLPGKPEKALGELVDLILAMR